MIMLMQQWGSEQSVDNSGASSHLYQPADTADSVVVFSSAWNEGPSEGS